MSVGSGVPRRGHRRHAEGHRGGQGNRRRVHRGRDRLVLRREPARPPARPRGCHHGRSRGTTSPARLTGSPGRSKYAWRSCRQDAPRRWGMASLVLSLLGHGLVALVVVRLAPHRPRAPIADSVEISVVEQPAIAGAPPAQPSTEAPKARSRVGAPASSHRQPTSSPRPEPPVAPHPRACSDAWRARPVARPPDLRDT